MTRADAIQEIRAITRLCRGPRREDNGAIAAALAAGKRDESGVIVAAAALDESLRQGCGRDFNDTIASGPFDGQVHAYACACGVSGIYRAPLYTLED